MQSASGACIEAIDGRRYVDFCMAFGPLILGHSAPAVKAAVAAALERGWSFGTADSASLALAELINKQLPWAEQIRFMNSGTEAVMTALRIARAATGRDKLLKFAGCYHGHTDAMLIRAGSGLAGQGSADSAGIPTGVVTDTLVAPLDDEAALDAIFAEHKDIAAAIIEPLPANYGLLPQRRNFLSRLAQRCRDQGSLLIFDEVITGFRLGFGGCTQDLGIQPDLVTWGKIIGGGFPVGAVAGHRSLMENLAPVGAVYQAGTLSANPIAMAAGHATLAALVDGEVYAYLEALGARLEQAVNESTSWQLQRTGSLFWLSSAGKGIVRSPAALPADLGERYSRLFQAGLKAGLYLPPSPYEVGFLSHAHTPEHMEMLAALLQSEG
jgi:glutamate-1-semialdehyde 2,1-aminomutase